MNLPVLGSWEHRVRPHNRPDQEVGTENVLDSPELRAKPVVGSWSVPAFDRMPGQIVLLHLFVIVNVAEFPPVMSTNA